MSLREYVLGEILPRKKHQLYSPGDLNRMIDSLLHPLARKDPRLWAVDTLLHAIVEQNPESTAKKFIRYNLPEITKEVSKRQARKTRKNV